ncbi:MAG: magnesium transporter [Erysipelotrichaceae bacterium]|nr:magnesium transporter [Erysipelotrichaceae bacterium]
MEQYEPLNTEEIQRYIVAKDMQGLRDYFDDHNIIDLAEVCEELHERDLLLLFKVLRKDVSATLFTYFTQDTKEELIRHLTGPDIMIMLENVATDDIADFIGEMPANLAKEILQAASPQTRDEINQLLSYKEGTAGSIMSTDYVELQDTDTVQVAIKKIKQQGKMAETINVCFVIDSQRRLIGSILLKEFLFEQRDVLISEIMDRDVIRVETVTDQEEAAEVMSKYDVTVVPVVNDENRLIGIITVDDIIDVIEEEVTEDIHKMAAVTPLEDSYMESGVLDLVRARLPWLLILMISGTFTSAIISGYEESLMAVPALSGFIPMIMGTAGNAGSQASTMVIRGIAVDGLDTKDVWKVLFKEFCISVICGIALFGINVVRISMFPSALVAAAGAVKVAIVVALAVVLAMSAGKMTGGLLPILVKAVGLDPAAVAAPVITTLVDALSLFIYFRIAVSFLGI